MTAPTPERRVGEDSVKRYATRTLASVATESEMVIQKLARDLLDEVKDAALNLLMTEKYHKACATEDRIAAVSWLNALTRLPVDVDAASEVPREK